MNIKSYLPFYKRNLAIAIPVMLSQAGQVMVQLADNMMVGHVGTVELAAASFAGSVFINGLIFGMGFTFGLTPLVGKAIGKNNFGEAGKLFKNGIFSNMVLAVVLTVLMFAVSFFMDRMGQPEEVVRQAIPYYLVLVASMVPFLLFFSFKQFAEGLGNTKTAMYITLFANVINIGLNYVLIYGKLGFPAYGLMGAGYATLIARIIMPICFIYSFIKKDFFRQFLSLAHQSVLHTKQAWKLAKIGIPIGLQMLIEVLSFSLGSVMMGWLGEVPLAAHQIALGMASLTFMIISGISSGTTIRVAHQFGAKSYEEMRFAAFASIHMVIAIMSVAAIAFVLLKDQIPYLFTSDPQVISVAASLIVIAAIFQVFDGIQVVSLGALRGLADVKIPMYFAFCCYIVVSLGISYLFAFVLGFGPRGIWFGFVGGLGLAAVLMITRFRKVSKKYVEG
ncbi:MATE family efflux transporter [Puteibacter caeruleilacunae]|nr:MATE family efflux transporter [Puteibacter caeruleilacunae]